MNADYLDLKISELQDGSSAATYKFTKAFENFGDVRAHMKGLNEYWSQQYKYETNRTVNNVEGGDGRQHQKGMYGIHMLQGEYVESSYSGSGPWVTNSTTKMFMPIYVAGDFLPVNKRTQQGTTISWKTSSTSPNGFVGSGYPEASEFERRINSSLGAPGYEWSSVWANDVFCSTINGEDATAVESTTLLAANVQGEAQGVKYSKKLGIVWLDLYVTYFSGAQGPVATVLVQGDDQLLPESVRPKRNLVIRGSYVDPNTGKTETNDIFITTEGRLYTDISVDETDPLNPITTYQLRLLECQISYNPDGEIVTLDDVE
jgi:hypothetical protein